MHKLLLLLTFTIMVTCMKAQDLKLDSTNIDVIIKDMTLEEKLNLLVGSQGNVDTDATAAVGNSSTLVPGAAGQLNGIRRLGVPYVVMGDGPAGVRIAPTRKSIDKTFYCTHFPVELAMSATWNTELVKSVGIAMGNEAKHYGIDILLAPAANIHRNPLNGRNFEYYSEDPLLSGKMATAEINGIQSQGIGTSLKHLALNNQETNRTNNDVRGGLRTFREIYLKPFEIAVKESQPWTVMTAYNRINGVYASESKDLLTDILRKEWGFKGVVVTDWYGGQYATNQMIAGNDLLMPGKASQVEEIKASISNGKLPMEIIDRNVKNVLECVVKTRSFKGLTADNNPDLRTHAILTRNAAVEGMVLLKNRDASLPLKAEVKDLAVFGRTSYDFIAGGTGSGDVNHAYVVSLIEGLKNAGFSIDSEVQKVYEAYMKVMDKKYNKRNRMAFLPKDLIPEMELDSLDLNTIAENNDAAVITIGKTSGEFMDRKIEDNYNLVEPEKELIKKVSEAFHKKGKKVTVILNVCGVVETNSWIEYPDAVLVAWLPGQEGGNSVADLLTGKETPSGRLPMSWPVNYNDVPSKDDFPTPELVSKEDWVKTLVGFMDERTTGNRKNFDVTTYNEGIYVGYRYYTTENVPVSFPFGYGLSYTSFSYDKPCVIKESNGDIKVTVSVQNTGDVAGKEVVQVYVSAPGKDMDKPARELKAFTKTCKLNPSEKETVTLVIPYESLASFNEKENCWQVEEGEYKVLIARDAMDSNPLMMEIMQKGVVTEKVRPYLLSR